MSTHDAHQLTLWVPRLRRYARALLRNREDADDLVQETLTRAWAKLDHWPAVADMRAWLFSMMHNLYVDHIRRHAGRTTNWDETSDADDFADHTSMQDMSLQLLDLETALAQLPAGQKEVLLLVALEGFSYAEVAQLLAIPQGTVMSRLARARERLRMLMEHGEHGDRPSRLRIVK